MGEFIDELQKVVKERHGGQAPETTPAGEKAGKETVEEAAASTGKEKPAPYDQDPKWKAARAAEKAVNSLLEKHGFESIEDIEMALDSGSSLSQLIGDRDAAELLAKAEKLDKYERYWKEQEELKRRENEDPDETISRLEAEIKKRDEMEISERSRLQEAEEASRALSEYSRTVSGYVEKSLSDIGDADVITFAKEFMGVDNPFSDIDITDKRQVAGYSQAALNRFLDIKKRIEDAAVEKYLKGKVSIPKGPAGNSSAASSETVKPNNMDEAGKLFREKIGQLFSR